MRPCANRSEILRATSRHDIARHSCCETNLENVTVQLTYGATINCDLQFARKTRNFTEHLTRPSMRHTHLRVLIQRNLSPRLREKQISASATHFLRQAINSHPASVRAIDETTVIIKRAELRTEKVQCALITSCDKTAIVFLSLSLSLSVPELIASSITSVFSNQVSIYFFQKLEYRFVQLLIFFVISKTFEIKFIILRVVCKEN